MTMPIAAQILTILVSKSHDLLREHLATLLYNLVEPNPAAFFNQVSCLIIKKRVVNNNIGTATRFTKRYSIGSGAKAEVARRVFERDGCTNICSKCKQFYLGLLLFWQRRKVTVERNK